MEVIYEVTGNLIYFTLVQLGITAFCLTTIVVNLFAIIGASGAKWRRGFMVPWLILYGFMVIILVGMYEWFTSDCYFEHKGYGEVIKICKVVRQKGGEGIMHKK